MADQRRAAATSRPFEADLKAWRMGLALSIAAGLLVACAVNMGWDDGGLLFAVAVVFAAGLVAALVLLVAQRFHVGFVLRLDADGLHSCALPPVPWDEVQGLDLRTHVGENTTTYSLVLKAAPEWFARHPWAWWQTWFFWPSAKVEPRARHITLSLVYTDADPRQVLAQARGLAKRYGGAGAATRGVR